MMKIHFKDLNKMFKEIPKIKLDYEYYEEILYNLVIFYMPKVEPKTKTNTIARIFGRSKNENFISDWLSFLFEHNVDVLNALLSLADYEVEMKDFVVVREHVFANNRRIDFLIESDEYIIGIENKIDSREQEDQLKDYSQELEKISNGKESIKILLKPQSNSMESNHGFVSVKYEEFVIELKKLNLDFIDDLRGSLLLDFIKHMEENIIMSIDNNFVFNEWTEYIYKYSEQIKTIKKAAKTEERNIIEYIKEHMISLVDDEFEWSFGQKRHEPSYIQLFKNEWDKQPNVHYELVRLDKDVIPTKYAVRIDIERGSTVEKKAIRAKLNLENYVNELGIYELDYSSEESFVSSVKIMIKGLQEVMKEYTDYIDDVFIDN